MANAVVIYDSKYGNTKTVAEEIAEGLRGGGVGDVLVLGIDAVKSEALDSYDALVIGSPNHIGGATRKIKKLIADLSKLEGKLVAVFDTYMGKDLEKATNRMLARIGAKAPGLEAITPGLSVLVTGMTGPIADGELAKSKAFG
ncbi:MAG: flavodoxin domain-containing protein, partial [Candidatus Bipolaricaulia bacterium]